MIELSPRKKIKKKNNDCRQGHHNERGKTRNKWHEDLTWWTRKLELIPTPFIKHRATTTIAIITETTESFFSPFEQSVESVKSTTRLKEELYFHCLVAPIVYSLVLYIGLSPKHHSYMHLVADA